jgi:hypothetical protein
MDYKLYHIKCRPPNVSYAKQAYILKCRNMTVERGLSLIFSSYEIAATCYPSVHRPARWLDSNGGAIFEFRCASQRLTTQFWPTKSIGWKISLWRDFWMMTIWTALVHGEALNVECRSRPAYLNNYIFFLNKDSFVVSFKIIFKFFKFSNLKFWIF